MIYLPNWFIIADGILALLINVKIISEKNLKIFNIIDKYCIKNTSLAQTSWQTPNVLAEKTFMTKILRKTKKKHSEIFQNSGVRRRSNFAIWAVTKIVCFQFCLSGGGSSKWCSYFLEITQELFCIPIQKFYFTKNKHKWNIVEKKIESIN